MKTLRSWILVTLVAGFAGQSFAGIYSFDFTSGFANGGVIPDGNTAGWSDTRTISGIDEEFITDVNVSLALAGGYNGDLYVYLANSSGFSVLLNRVGRTSGDSFGYGDAGLNVTFDDAAANGDIHGYQDVPGFSAMIANGGAWSPDGRNVNPVFALDTDSRTRLLDQFNNGNPNDNWTLFIADLSAGEQSAMVGWGLNITATAVVPEPSTASFVALGLALWCVARRKVRG